MKRLVALVVGVFGFRALFRRRRSHDAAPAEELRAKLAATRTAEPEPPSAHEATAPDEPLDGVDARRAAVHARARESIDELSS